MTSTQPTFPAVSVRADEPTTCPICGSDDLGVYCASEYREDEADLVGCENCKWEAALTQEGAASISDALNHLKVQTVKRGTHVGVNRDGKPAGYAVRVNRKGEQEKWTAFIRIAAPPFDTPRVGFSGESEAVHYIAAHGHTGPLNV